jgi:hypothetical protein
MHNLDSYMSVAGEFGAGEEIELRKSEEGQPAIKG